MSPEDKEAAIEERYTLGIHDVWERAKQARMLFEDILQFKGERKRDKKS